MSFPDSPDMASPRLKSRKLYIVLAAVVGTVGVHNFYVGRWREAWAQLVLGGFSLVEGVKGFDNFMNQLQTNPPDLSDPLVAQATLSAALGGGGWIATASTAAFVIVGVWVVVDIFAVKRDGAGNRLG